MAVENFQGALRAYLLSDPAIAGLVSTRIYSSPAPQSVSVPYVVISYQGKLAMNTLSAFSGVITDRWQIDAYGSTADSVQAVAKAIFNKLHLKNHETWSGYKVYSAKFDNENDLSEPLNNGSENMYHRIQQDFLIKHVHEI